MKDVNVNRVQYNWFASDKFHYGEHSECEEVGENRVVEITYHESQGEGDSHYCDIFFENGKMERVFNLNKVTGEYGNG